MKAHTTNSYKGWCTMTKETFTEEEILAMEQQFIDKYYTGNGKQPLRTLFRLFKGCYRKLILSSFFFVIKSLAVMVMPIVTANILNAIVEGGDEFWTTLALNASVLLVTLILNVPCHRLYVHYRSKASRAVEAALRGSVVKKLQKLTIRFDAAMQSGRIQSKIIRDVDNIVAMFNQGFNAILEVVVNLSVIVCVLIVKADWAVIAFFLLSVPTAVSVGRPFLKNFKRKNRAFRKEMESTSSHVVDMVEMLPITRAHALEEVEVSRMNERVSLLANRGVELDGYGALFSSVNWATIQSFNLACLVFTGILAFQGKLLLGDVSLYSGYFSQFIGYVNIILSLIPIIASGTEAITSVGEILAAEDVEENEGKDETQQLKGDYLFDNVTFGYEQDHPVLKELDLHVSAGETVALVGESGAGKTTILNLVTGFYMPDSGNVLIDGKDIREMDLVSYRKHIAMVPQTSTMFSGTIRENITYGMTRPVSDEELSQVLEAACLTDVVAKLPQGVDTPVGERGASLSGGQRQRVSIARAIIRNPSVIILDEATSALDTISEQKIQQAIENLTCNRTTFIVAHRLSTIRNADKIAVMQDGKCIEYGTYEELMAKQGVFYRLKILQA